MHLQYVAVKKGVQNTSSIQLITRVILLAIIWTCRTSNNQSNQCCMLRMRPSPPFPPTQSAIPGEGGGAVGGAHAQSFLSRALNSLLKKN